MLILSIILLVAALGISITQAGPAPPRVPLWVAVFLVCIERLVTMLPLLGR